MRREGERGQAIVEFAFAASIALTLIFGVIEFGRAIFAFDLVAQAARVGTRYAIVNAAACKLSKSSCETAITNYMLSKVSGIDQTALIPAPLVTWQQVNATDCYDSGCYVNIQLSYVFSFVALPFPSQTLTSTSQMVISQ
ncbi:MAG: hypothetical protein NVS3B16_21730 [Vulcanimicrobiaceae bacterium]